MKGRKEILIISKWQEERPDDASLHTHHMQAANMLYHHSMKTYSSFIVRAQCVVWKEFPVFFFTSRLPPAPSSLAIAATCCIETA